MFIIFFLYDLGLYISSYKTDTVRNTCIEQDNDFAPQKKKVTHIYVFDFLELILQVFGQLVRALYRTPLTGQVV